MDISAGFSHNIIFDIPKELKVSAETEKGKSPIVTIFGIDKQLVGAVAKLELDLRESQNHIKEKVLDTLMSMLERKLEKQLLSKKIE